MTTFTTQDRQDAQRDALGVTKVKFANDSVESGWIYIEQTTARPLLESEILRLFHDQGNRDFQLRFDALKFARAIERAHGIGE